MKRTLAIAFLTALAVMVSENAPAAILYTIPGMSYDQDFNTLPNTPQNVTLGASPNFGWKNDDPAPPPGNFSILGWHLHHPILQAEGGFDGHQRMRIGAGTATTGAFMSFGASGSPERALGMLNSNTMAAAGSNAYFGAVFTNLTGRTLASFTLDYKGEQWRDGGAAVPNPQSLTFDYSLNAISIEDPLATFVDVPALDFVSPTFTNLTTGNALDGNDSSLPLPVNKLAIGPFTVTGLNWQPNTDLWIRWTDLSDAGNDHGPGHRRMSVRRRNPRAVEPDSARGGRDRRVGIAAAWVNAGRIEN